MKLTPYRKDEIREVVSGRVLTDVPMSRFTSLRIGGVADLVAEPDNLNELAFLLRYLRDKAIPRVILGAGTNVIFRDAGFRGVVIRTGSLKGFHIHQNGRDAAVVSAAAGLPLPVLVSRACRLGWTGLEPLWGIPGTVGGGVVVNAGAGGVCMADFLEEVKLVTERGEHITLPKADLTYGYRYMKLPAGSVVVEATLRLSMGVPEKIDAELEKAKSLRLSSQPSDQPSAGCIFKNPSPDNPAGAIIDRLGFKGLVVGGAQVSPVHANFIVNLGGASASDVLDLIGLIRSRVKETEQIDLELEVQVIGERTAHE